MGGFTSILLDVALPLLYNLYKYQGRYFCKVVIFDAPHCEIHGNEVISLVKYNGKLSEYDLFLELEAFSEAFSGSIMACSVKRTSLEVRG